MTRPCGVVVNDDARRQLHRRPISAQFGKVWQPPARPPDMELPPQDPKAGVLCRHPSRMPVSLASGESLRQLRLRGAPAWTWQHPISARKRALLNIPARLPGMKAGADAARVDTTGADFERDVRGTSGLSRHEEVDALKGRRPREQPHLLVYEQRAQKPSSDPVLRLACPAIRCHDRVREHGNVE